MEFGCIILIMQKWCAAAALAGVFVLSTGVAVSQIGPPKQTQPDDDAPVLRVDVDVVNVLFSVRDNKGALVGNLEKDAFQVLEDGKPQTVKFFERQTDLPLTIGLLVDTSRSQENLIGIEREAASQFFTQVLKPKDMAFLIQFGSDAELLQDLTGSPKLLKEGLNQLKVSSAIGGFHPGPVPTAGSPKGTILYDAVYLAATDRLKGEVGRKAIVVISDGADQGSRYSIDEAIAAAHKSDAIIYGIYYVDNYNYIGDEGALKKMARETGGRSFRIGGKTTLNEVFRQIQEEMRSQYALGYTPTNPVKDGSFRKLEIKTANKDLKVQARRGYFATPNERN
jgi:VWFA-related protein